MNDAAKIDVVIQPKSSRDEVVGLHGNAIKIKLTAPPVDGKANSALISFLAKKLKIPKTSIIIIRGQASRHKTLSIDGIDPQRAKEQLIKTDR